MRRGQNVPFRAIPPFALGLLVVIASCSASTHQAPGLVMRVETQGLTPGVEFDTLAVHVDQRDVGGTWSEVFDYSRPTREVAFPTTVSVTRGSRPDQGVRIAITGLLGGPLPGGLQVVERRVQLILPSDRVAELVMVLSAACAGAKGTCSAPETSCQPTTGTCGSDLIDVATLPTYAGPDGAANDGGALSADATGPDQDASASPDASPDANPDANPDATANEAGPVAPADAGTDVGTPGCESASLRCVNLQPEQCTQGAFAPLGAACAADERCGAAACVSAEWALWPMPNAAQEPRPARYLDAPQVVTDSVTGLVWQREAVAAGTWSGAASTCAALSLAGSDDWRLPTLIELVSIVDSAQADPSLDRDHFGALTSEAFWSSTPVAGDPSRAWGVSFYVGRSDTVAVNSVAQIRCVRAPSPPAAVHGYTLGSGTVTDLATNLTWQRTATPGVIVSDVGTFCQNQMAGDGVFRLPTLKELQTLMDYSVPGVGDRGAKLDPVAFPSAPAGPYWSATTSAVEVGARAYADFATGQTADKSAADSTAALSVRCVR